MMKKNSLRIFPAHSVGADRFVVYAHMNRLHEGFARYEFTSAPGKHERGSQHAHITNDF